MYKVKLTYCSIDRLFYVYLYDNKGNELEQAYFSEKEAATDFYNKVI